MPDPKSKTKPINSNQKETNKLSTTIVWTNGKRVRIEYNDQGELRQKQINELKLDKAAYQKYTAVVARQKKATNPQDRGDLGIQARNILMFGLSEQPPAQIPKPTEPISGSKKAPSGGSTGNSVKGMRTSNVQGPQAPDKKAYKTPWFVPIDLSVNASNKSGTTDKPQKASKSAQGPKKSFNPDPKHYRGRIDPEDWDQMLKDEYLTPFEIHKNDPGLGRLAYSTQSIHSVKLAKYQEWLTEASKGFKQRNGVYTKTISIPNTKKTFTLTYWSQPTKDQIRSDIDKVINGALKPGESGLGPDNIRPIEGKYPVLNEKETNIRLRELRDIINYAAQNHDTEVYDEAYLEFVYRKHLDPEDTNNFGLPRRPLYDPHNVPSTNFPGYTLQDELNLYNPNIDDERYDSITSPMVMPESGYGRPGKPYYDRVIQWIRDNVSLTGKNAQAFLYKVAELRQQKVHDDEILKYIQDPKHFKDLQEQSSAMGGIISKIAEKIPIVDTYIGLADTIDMVNQIMSSYDLRRRRGESVQDALLHVAEEVGEGAIEPIKTIFEKWRDPDLSFAGKVSAVYNAALALQTIYHGIHGAVAFGKAALDSPLGSKLRSWRPIGTRGEDFSAAIYKPYVGEGASTTKGKTYHVENTRPESINTTKGKIVVAGSDRGMTTGRTHTELNVSSKSSNAGSFSMSNGNGHSEFSVSTQKEYVNPTWSQGKRGDSHKFGDGKSLGESGTAYHFDPSHKSVYEEHIKAWDDYSKTPGLSDAQKKLAVDARDQISKDLREGRPNKGVEDAVSANGGWKGQMEKPGQVIVGADENRNLMTTLRDKDATNLASEQLNEPAKDSTGIHSNAVTGNTIDKPPAAASEIFNDIFKSDSTNDGPEIGPSFRTGNSHVDFRRPAGAELAGIWPIFRLSSELQEQVKQLKVPERISDVERDVMGKAFGVENINNKPDSIVHEELSGTPPNPARQDYHDHLDAATENNLVSPETNQRLKDYHDHQADLWSKETGQRPSDYFEHHTPQLREGIGDQAWETGAKGKAISTVAGKSPTELEFADMESLKKSPEYAAKVTEEMSTYPGLDKLPKNLDAYAQFLAENLVALYKLTPQKFLAKIRGTFYGANKFMARLAAHHGFTLEQVSGATAVLSANTKWEHNINNVERLIDAMAAGKSHVWDSKMDKWATAKFGDKVVQRLRGKSLSDLTDVKDKARWIQAYDRIHHENGFRTLNPDGTFSEFVMRKDGNKWSRMWNNPGDIQKAIKILESSSFHEITDHLGKGQKVRNFYNNLVNPWSEHGLVTTDTHMVAASLFSPLSGKDREVLAAFGSAGKAKGGDPSGIQGTNPVYMEAARLAAKELGVDPHEVQSIAWHMGKALFDPDFKRGAGNKVAISEIWRKVGINGFTPEMARGEILKLVGGVKDMPWLDAKPSGAKSSYK